MGERKILGEAEDDEQSGYEWACARVVQQEDGHFAIYTDSGCSCNGPWECGPGDLTAGPAATLGGLFDELNVDKADHPKFVLEAFVDAMKRMNDETLAAVKQTLGLA